MLNYHYAKTYGGQMILRFDDTNPTAEKIEFVENIQADLKTLQITPDRVTFSSDYFDKLQDYCR
jgi:glutamyl-tRNA synthetase